MLTYNFFHLCVKNVPTSFALSHHFYLTLYFLSPTHFLVSPFLLKPLHFCLNFTFCLCKDGEHFESHLFWFSSIFNTFPPFFFFFLSCLTTISSLLSSSLLFPTPPLCSLFPTDRQLRWRPRTLHGASPTWGPWPAPSPDAVYQEGAPVTLQRLQKCMNTISTGWFEKDELSFLQLSLDMTARQLFVVHVVIISAVVCE